MELIYLWSEKYRNLHEIGFNFSRNFDVIFNKNDRNEPFILRKKNKKYHMFDDTGKVTQISAIIGKNGCGKTNILNLLGIRRNERLRINSKEKVDYFLIYHFEEDLFVIEGNRFALVKPFLENIEQVGFVTDTYSILVKYENGKLLCINFLQFNKEAHENNVYFSFRNKFDKEMAEGDQSFEIDPEYTVLFNRIYLSTQNTGYLAKYKMLIDFNNNVNNGQDLNLKVIKIRNNSHLTIAQDLFIDLDNKLEIEERFNSNIKILGHDNDKFKPKEHFINKLVYSICRMMVPWVIKEPIELVSINKKIKEEIQNKSYVEYCFDVISMLLNIKEKDDQYFSEKDKNTVIEVFKKYIKIIETFDDNYFLEEKIIIPTYNDYEQEVIELLELLDNINFLDGSIKSMLDIFSLSFGPLSSGEDALISLFAALHHGLTQNILESPNNAILLLDEPDNFMHPEWSRMLLNEIIVFLNSFSTSYKSFQIIITTHSPFVISDLSNENVIALEKDHEIGNCSLIDLNETFANNIHTLLSQEFFMTSTLGEYAKNRINEVIELINSPSHLSQKEKEKIEYFISIIGESLIKNKLQIMADQKFNNQQF